MMRKRLKSAAAAAMALVMLGGALPAIPCGTKLLNAPLTAHAAGSAVFDQDTRTLTLNGAVTKEQIWEYRTNDAVKSIVANEGCVLPADCSYLFNSEFIETVIEDEFSIDIWAWGGVNRIDLSAASSSAVTNMKAMFEDYAGESLDLSSFDTSNVQDMSDMFSDCESLETIYVSDLWSTAAVTQSDNMFSNSFGLKGGNGTEYDENHKDKEYARIDGKDGKPGYLTYKEYSLPTTRNYVKGVSLSLDGTIHINFYTMLNDSVKKAVLSGPYCEEEITDFQKVQGGAFIGYTKLSYAVNATQRTDKVSLKLYDKDGNLLDIYNSSMQKVPGSVIRYSVKDYFESYTGEPRAYDWEALTEERNTLVEWLERYMKAAENYFLGKTHTVLPENYTPRMFDFVNEIKSAYKLGMVLNSGTDLLIYTDADRVVLSGSPNDVDLEKYTDKDGRSCFIIRNIPASKTVDTKEIRINGESYYVCPRDYCYYAIQQCEEGDATWDLMWAFYEYSKAAEYYTFDCTDD